MNSRLDWLVLSDYYSIYVTTSPPEGNNTNTSDKLEFVLFFFNDYFGLKVIRYKNKKINIKWKNNKKSRNNERKYRKTDGL